jgi:hypothetical protein
VNHHIHSVIVSYNRVHLTEQAITSYLNTVTLPHTLVVMDNGSGRETWERLVLLDADFDLVLLGENKYPGYATNRGWERAPKHTTLLHRGDNDFAFLPGWCDTMLEAFERHAVGQVGLRTAEEEMWNSHNVGGNNVVRRELWDQGLRYDERPWPQISKKVPGYTEDSFLSPAVTRLGWVWTRVERPCIRSLSVEAPGDPDFDAGYYDRTWADRGMPPR